MGRKIFSYVAYVLAAILIGVLIWIVHRQITEYHMQDDPMLYTLKEVLKPLLSEVGLPNLKLYKGERSYTINKEKVFLCLYNENGEYYNLNTLIYVLCHEISHILNSEDVGHTPKFHEKFEQLLDRAIELGAFNPSIPIPKDYCGGD